MLYWHAFVVTMREAFTCPANQALSKDTLGLFCHNFKPGKRFHVSPSPCSTKAVVLTLLPFDTRKVKWVIHSQARKRFTPLPPSNPHFAYPLLILSFLSTPSLFLTFVALEYFPGLDVLAQLCLSSHFPMPSPFLANTFFSFFFFVLFYFLFFSNIIFFFWFDLIL